MQNENSKEVLLVKSLSHKKANELRSILTKQVRNIWIYVFETKNPEEFDVHIGNEWGGKPTETQQALASELVKDFLPETDSVETLRDHEFVDVTDEVQFSV